MMENLLPACLVKLKTFMRTSVCQSGFLLLNLLPHNTKVKAAVHGKKLWLLTSHFL